MNCFKHPDRPAFSSCAACAEHFCNNCLVTVKHQKFCAACKGTAISKDGMAATAGQTGHPHGEPEAAGESLKYAIIGIFCMGIILGPVAIIKGIEAKRFIDRHPGTPGAGKALAGIIIGSFISLVYLLFILLAAVAPD